MLGSATARLSKLYPQRTVNESELPPSPACVKMSKPNEEANVVT